jgi:hypothetical protein
VSGNPEAHTGHGVGPLWLAREVSGWRRMATTSADASWRAACTAQGEVAELRGSGSGEGTPDVVAVPGPTVSDGRDREDGLMANDFGATPEEEPYSMYEALIDPRDEAELLDQEAEGQSVCDVWRDRQRELRELLPELGLGHQVAEREAER